MFLFLIKVISVCDQNDDQGLLADIQTYKSYYSEIKLHIPEYMNDAIINKLYELGTQAFASRDKLFYRYCNIAVESITHDYSSKVDEEDIISIALSKLQDIIEHFQPQNFKTRESFVNFVKITIKNHTLRYIQEQSMPFSIRTPEEWLTYKRRIRSYRIGYINTHHKEPTMEEIADGCKLSKKMVVNILDMDNIESRYYAIDNLRQIILDPEQQMIEDLKNACIISSINALEPREKEIYMLCLSDVSRKEIALQFNISQQRVSQIYNKVNNIIITNLQEDPILSSIKNSLFQIKKAIINHST